MNEHMPEPLPDDRSDDRPHERPDAAPAREPAPRTTVVFEDLTLGQALGYLVWRPVETARLFWQVLTRDEAARPAASPREGGYTARPAPAPEPWPDEDDERYAVERYEVERYGGERYAADRYEIARPPDLAADDTAEIVVAKLVVAEASAEDTAAPGDRRLWGRIGALATATLLAIQGGYALHRAATTPATHAAGEASGAFGWFLLAGALVVGAALADARGFWIGRFPRAAERIRARFGSGQRARAWTVGLSAAILALLWLALLAPGGLLGATLLIALAAALWVAIVIGTGPVEAAPAVVAPEPAPVLAEDEDDEGDPAAYVVRSRVAQAAPAADAVERRSVRSTAWFDVHRFPLLLVPVATFLSVLAYLMNVERAPSGTVTDVVLTPGGVLMWASSVWLWVGLLGLDWSARYRRRHGVLSPIAAATQPWWRGRSAWLTGAALLAIVALGAFFRLSDLASTPPEMTSDHIEKLLDSLRVSEGYYGVFFPNNGGREGFQMYVVAFIADVLGVGFNFTALKLATVAEGLITLPALWWMARQVIGTETPRARHLGNWVGLALAGLVAVSSWHVMLSRLGLRIVLTPLTAALAIGFLARVMRHNRMRDYLALGIVLGAGVYFYQANRMLPALAVIGVALAVIARLRRWREVPRALLEAVGLVVIVGLPLLVYWYAASLLEGSGRSNLVSFGEQLSALLPVAAMAWFAILALAVRSQPGNVVLQYGGGLLATAVVALALYIPMYHYSVLAPDQYWNRTRGRLFGEEAFWRIDPATGQTVAYEPSLDDQLERFWDQRDVFVDNYADALRMYHWQGDGAWINNAHSRPALDGLTGGLLILGLVVWAVRALRGDSVGWLLPASVLVMLLPSALTLAYTIENPSFTRASGTIPPVFLIAALPLGTLGAWLAEAPARRRGQIAGAAGGVATIGLALALAIGPNWENFFTDYRLSYSQSWKPYSAIAEPLEAFAQGEGSYGNAFMVAYPHWLDHRILGTMAGDIGWPNGLVTRDDIFGRIAANRGTRYQYDPSKPLFVMFHPQDLDTQAFLEETFPGGTLERYEYTYETENGVTYGEFYIYRVLAGFIGVEQ